MKKLLSLLESKYRFYTLLTPILIIGEVILEVTIPMIMALIVDIGITGGDIRYVLCAGGVMVLMSLFSLIFGVGAGRTAAVAGMGFAKNIRRELFHKIQDFSYSNIDRFGTSSLITRITTDVTNTQNAFMMVIRMLVRSPIMLISASFMAFRLNSKLSMIFLFAIPILAAALALIITKAYPKFQHMLKKYDALNAKIQENLIAIRVVKAFVRGDYENEEFEKASAALTDTQKKAEKTIIFNMPIMQLIMYSSIIAVLWIGGNMIIAGSMETGNLVAFISYITQILMSLMMISMAFTMLVISKASVSRICEVLNDSPDISDNDGDETLSVKDGSVDFDKVCFSYKGDISSCALRNIDLHIASGETVGIIGGTGSSKSTLVHLIPRLYETTDGSVKVGGRDVRDYKLSALRNEIAVVLQKNVLFSGTIIENLRWGNKDASDEEVINACKAAQAHDFIMSFPDGYNTELGQGGVNVSGGQKQRLCIARALLKKPKIIILDDSTSAVDTATDSKIRKAFSKDLADTTTIIIAQRISSVCDADKIVVLDNGRINTVGTHEELLKTNEIYKEVYNSQQKGVA